MTDYFSEYSAFVGAKSLPSPANTPYETPGFIRSQRALQASTGASRGHSVSPPPLPPDSIDNHEKSHNDSMPASDPRLFTPTLHASLVSEIFNLRRELESKNNLVDHLESSLATAKTESESISEQLSRQVKDARETKQHLVQVETGTQGVVDDLVKERDAARRIANEFKAKYDAATRKGRLQDDEAARTQNLWETEQKSWENERRQFERRIHITESRLASVVQEINAQHAADVAQSLQTEETLDDNISKDPELNYESDNTSIRSCSPTKYRWHSSGSIGRGGHLRSSLSLRHRGSSVGHTVPNRSTLADEIGREEEHEDHLRGAEHVRDGVEPYVSQQMALSDVAEEVEDGVQRSPGSSNLASTSVATESTPEAPPKVVGQSGAYSISKALPIQPGYTADTTKILHHAEYVDTGYQPSPPRVRASKGSSTESLRTFDSIETTPQIKVQADDNQGQPHDSPMNTRAIAARVAASPLSPPQTPVIDDNTWSGIVRSSHSPFYRAASTQTDESSITRPTTVTAHSDSLEVPTYVPSITIHPPASRPSSPRPYVLPPGTRNASTQATLPWPCREAFVQTEEIRVDMRLFTASQKPFRSRLLPSPTLLQRQRPEDATALQPAGPSNAMEGMAKKGITRSIQASTNSSPETSRENTPTPKSLRSLRAIDLPRPVLAPNTSHPDPSSGSPLHRSEHYGVTRPLRSSGSLALIQKNSELSDCDEIPSDWEPANQSSSIPALNQALQGRLGLMQSPSIVSNNAKALEGKDYEFADSFAGAPAPSVASSRANSQRTRVRQPAKRNALRDHRIRSPSFGSMASSNFSTQSALPGHLIPARSSSRQLPLPRSHGGGSHSPTPAQSVDSFSRDTRDSRSQPTRINSLRRVYSDSTIRHDGREAPAPGLRRRRRVAELTPVQSVAFETPEPTRFPIPELPTPIKKRFSTEHTSTSVGLSQNHTLGHSSSKPEDVLVDAIAATMVGQWMWKYIRKRTPFGRGDEVDEMVANGTNTSINAAHGTRHKRWVWLSPYEKTIMWDSKQPMSGPALLGKNGRKSESASMILTAPVQSDLTDKQQ